MADNLADPNIVKNTPKTLQGLAVVIERYNKSLVDITSNITEISLYESIYTPFMYGEIILIDNSAMLSVFPFIGQEKVLIVWEREDTTITKVFDVTDVFDVNPINEGTGGYGISISSEKQMRNAISLFSKSYKDNSAEIIKKIYTEFLSSDLDVKIQGYYKHNIVFPYIKPLQAINMIQKATPAADETPMFVFESLYDERPTLNSMMQMLDQDPVLTIDPKVTAASNPGSSNLDMNKYRNQAYKITINRAYNTLDQLGSGAYSCQTLGVDIGNKSYEVTDFDFTIHAPTICQKDWITTFFTFDGVANTDNPDNVLVNGIRSTRAPVQYRNEKAFEDYPNLNTIDENHLAAMRSYMKRLKSISVNVHMNSVPELRVGKTVELKTYRFSPKFNNEDPEDKVNSGVFLIAALRHYLKNGEYTVSMELVRDGIGEDAELYVNGNPPNFGNPLRSQESLLDNIEARPVSSFFGRFI